MGKRRNIYISNIKVEELLENSRNASRLIEEAIIFYNYAYNHGYLYDREFNRIDVQKLLSPHTTPAMSYTRDTSFKQIDLSKYLSK